MTQLTRWAAFAWTACVLTCGVASAATLPPNFSETLVASGMSNPTAMEFAPDGRLFVCEQGGALRVIKDGALLPDPFVTVSVDSNGERGLLGVTFDPAFQSNHFVYVYYTATSPVIHNRLSRFTADGDVAVAGSEVVILELEALTFTNHNGGAIHFGPDGKLYVAVGENATASNSQTLSNRLGKILRINSDGSIPSDNPFYNVASDDNRSIWALGLRNPFTFAFQPLFGRMMINDVGAVSWEEVNEGVAGSNYGWPITEGATSNPNFRTPLYAYTHDDGCAITGGAFHDILHPQFPAQYWGGYFFSDICGGWIRFRSAEGGVTTFATDIPGPVDLKMSSDGSLYYLARGGGVVYKITYGPVAPAIDFSIGGGDGPATFTGAVPMVINWSFNAGVPGVVNPAELYVLLASPFGVLWLDPTQGFVPALSRVFAGAISSFGPTPFLNVPNADTLPNGVYLWMIIVDDEVDGVPGFDTADTIITILN